MSNIEFVQGQESHSSYWGKFYIKGLETYQVKEDFEENKSLEFAQACAEAIQKRGIKNAPGILNQ